MSRIWMSHADVTHMNESCHTYDFRQDAAARADDEERSKKTFISQLDTAQGSVAQQQEQIQVINMYVCLYAYM